MVLVGILLPSLLMGLALRRWFGPLPWSVVGIALALTLAFLVQAVFTTRVPVPLDEVMRGYPYRGILGAVESKNALTNDTVKQILPWMQTAREELLHFRAPLWNRYLFSGYPLLGNGQSAPFAPAFLATLFVPLPQQLVAMAGLKIFVALIFGWLFLRDEGVSSAAALFGSVVFAFSVFQTVYLYYPMTTVTSLLPAAAFAVGRVVRGAPDAGAPMVLLALVTAAVASGGHPESAVHIGIACVCVIAAAVLLSRRQPVLVSRPQPVILSRPQPVILSRPQPVILSRPQPVILSRVDGEGPPASGASSRLSEGGPSLPPYPPPPLRTAVGHALLAALFGLALSSPAWVPVVEQALVSVRAASLAATPHAPLNPLVAWTLLNPDGFGNPSRGNWQWIYNYSIVASTYLGLIPVALLAGIRKKRDLLLTFIAVLLFLVAMNWTPIGRALNAIPPLSLIAQDRLRFVVLFFVATIAARVVDRVPRGRVAIAAIAILAAAAWLLRAKWGITLGPQSAIGAIALAAFALVAIVRPRFAPAAALIATVVELFTFNIGFNVPVSRAYFAPSTPILEKLRELTRGAEPSRIAGHDWTFLPNTAAQYGFEDIRGNDPMASARYARFFEPFAAQDASDVKRVQDLDHPALPFLGVRFALTDPSVTLSPAWVLRYEGPDGKLYESARWQRRFFGLGAGDVKIGAIVQESPTRLRVAIETAEPAVIRSSQVDGRGWRVHGATKLEATDDPFIRFRVPAGKHTVTLRYLPWSFYGSCLVALLALYIGAHATLANRRADPGPDAPGVRRGLHPEGDRDAADDDPPRVG